ERSFSLAQDRFLADHTMGRQTSAAHPDLLPLPTVPLTVSAEILAEAAACLLTGYVVCGIEIVRSYRWLALDQCTLTVGVLARLQPDDAGDTQRRVHVQLFELGAAGERQLAVE